MHRPPSLLLLLAYTAVLAGCCAAPAAAPRTGATQAVAIDNPRHAMLVLACPDLGIDELRLGDGAAIRRELAPGRWCVRCGLGDSSWQLPLPLCAAAERPSVVHLTVTPPPPARADLCWIPAGPALVGDVLGVGQEDERPARIVDVPGFWIARTETTNAEFAAFLNAVVEVPDDWLALDSRKCRVHRDATGRFATDAPDLPVVTVSREGARAYCTWRATVTGERCRLPSEVEWEKAARGPGSCTYDYGDVFRRDAANQESGRLQAVAALPRRGFGTCDLTGNAFEWVVDAYRSTPDAPLPDPPYYVLRGGSFVLDGIYLRNSMRMKLRPDVRADDVGFRVVVEPAVNPAEETK